METKHHRHPLFARIAASEPARTSHITSTLFDPSMPYTIIHKITKFSTLKSPYPVHTQTHTHNASIQTLVYHCIQHILRGAQCTYTQSTC